MPAAAELSSNTDQARHVLVVDDDHCLRESWPSPSSPRAQGRTARDGQEALDHVQSSAPQAIVRDLMMPRLDGWTFVERSRAEAGCAGAPIVALSASRTLRTAARQRAPSRIGAVIAKPFELEVFPVAVERLLRPRTP